MKPEYIVIKGSFFTIEWYYDDRGNSQALEYFDSLTEARQDKAFYLFKSMGNTGRIHNEEKFRNEGDQIYAFKPLPDRFLCFFIKGAKIIITNAFEKKTDKLPLREKEKALKNKFDYIDRVKKGLYYVEEKNKK